MNDENFTTDRDEAARPRPTHSHHFLIFLLFFAPKAIDVGVVIDISQKRKTGLLTQDPSSALAFIEGRKASRSMMAVPLFSLYNHLLIYMFLPIAKKRVAVAFGSISSLVCIGLYLGIELTQVQNIFSSLRNISMFSTSYTGPIFRV